MAQAAREFLEGQIRQGAVAPGSQVAGEMMLGMQQAFRYVRDHWRELAGQIAPRATALNRAVGEALARLSAARGVYPREAATEMIDKVLGEKATEKDARYVGAAAGEWRLRTGRAAFLREAQQSDAAAGVARQKAAVLQPGLEKDRLEAAAKDEDTRAKEYRQKAKDVTTIIGKPNSPFATDADWQKAMADPKVQQFMANWKQHMTPVMERNFKTAMGMEDTDPIHSITQVPDMPMNFRALRASDPDTPGTIGTGAPSRGNLKGVLTPKFQFAQEAGLDADRYDMDARSMIEHSLRHGITRATSADFWRTALREGQADVGTPGQKITGMTEVDFAKPPVNTPNTKPGDALFVMDGMYDEVRKVLGPDKPFNLPVITPVANTITKASLFAQTAEGATHMANQLTMMVKAGLHPWKFLTNAAGVIAKDPELMRRMVDLARIDALKAKGFESGSYLPEDPRNPMTWMKQALDVTDRAMRLTMEDAFDSMAGKRQGLVGKLLYGKGVVADTETNKRNFINQMGQYDARVQNDLVRGLRDSGIGPFATAGSNFWIQGWRSLLMNPGVEATSMRGQIQLRAEVLARHVAIFGAAAAVNFLRWGRLDGDENTPFGNIKIAETPDGKTVSLPFGSIFTPLPRGLREVGATAAIQSYAQGGDTVAAVHEAKSDWLHGLLHPAAGPAVGFGYTAATGYTTSGRHVARSVSTAHTAEGAAAAARQGLLPAGSSPEWEDLGAALYNFNPAVSALTGAQQPKEDMPWYERAAQLGGRFGPQFRGESLSPQQRRQRQGLR